MSIGTLFGRSIGQSWDDLEIWEEVLNENPHIFEIIEIGTYHGGMSCYLWTQAKSRGLGFRTYDINFPFPANYPLFDFFQMDVLENTISLSKQDVVLFCDGGNKREEVRKYSDLLTDDSILAVHDFQTEFLLKDIPDRWRIFKVNSLAKTIFLMTCEHLNKREIREGRRYG